jgi:hypothetical protein
MEELQGMRREGRNLAETARDVNPKIGALRHVSEAIRNANHDPRLSNAAQKLISLADDLCGAFDDLETLALRVSFSAHEK